MLAFASLIKKFHLVSNFYKNWTVNARKSWKVSCSSGGDCLPSQTASCWCSTGQGSSKAFPSGLCSAAARAGWWPPRSSGTFPVENNKFHFQKIIFWKSTRRKKNLFQAKTKFCFHWFPKNNLLKMTIPRISIFFILKSLMKDDGLRVLQGRFLWRTKIDKH